LTANAYPLILYDNRFLDGAGATLTATDTAAGFSVLNIMDLRPFTFWQAASAGEKYLTISSVGGGIDSLAIMGHNLHTANATVSVLSSDDFVNWTERLAGFIPASDKALFKAIEHVHAQHWALKIVTAAISPRVGVCILGERLVFPRYLTGSFDPFPEKINGVAARTKAGHMIQATLSNISVSVKASFKEILPSWIESTFRPAWDAHLSQLKPFFWVWDVTNHPADVFFLSIPEGFNLSMPYDPYRRSMNLTFEGIKET
jgi:hypothetical protein